jgi:hypothetical protein
MQVDHREFLAAGSEISSSDGTLNQIPPARNRFTAALHWMRDRNAAAKPCV